MDGAGQPNLRITSMSHPRPPGPVSFRTRLTPRSHRRRWALQARCVPYVCPEQDRRRHVAHACAAGFPDPFAVATINGEQTRTTSVIKKTLNPYWNESFDMYAALGLGLARLRIMTLTHDTGKSTKRAFWRFRSLTRRSSRRRTRASWASSMSA